MRQMITRIDDDLHARLKAKAAEQGRSVNEFVTDVLKTAVNKTETRAEWHERMVREGKLVQVDRPRNAHSLEEIEQLSRGWGTAVSEALDWTRGER